MPPRSLNFAEKDLCEGIHAEINPMLRGLHKPASVLPVYQLALGSEQH